MFIIAAISSVQRNLAALSMYVAGVLALQLSQVSLALSMFPERAEPGTPLDFQRQAFLLVAGLATAILYAALQSIVFARMGKEIDRPLWRCAGDWEALRRFFQIWFLINITGVALEQFAILAFNHGIQPVVALCYMLRMFLFLVAVPVGACVMFAGALDWKEFGKNLAPLLHEVPWTLTLILLNLVQFALVEYTSTLRPDAGQSPLSFWMTYAAVGIVAAYIDCVAFAGTWHICMEHRNADQDVDFDF